RPLSAVAPATGTLILGSGSAAANASTVDDAPLERDARGPSAPSELRAAEAHRASEPGEWLVEARARLSAPAAWNKEETWATEPPSWAREPPAWAREPETSVPDRVSETGTSATHL